MKHVQGTTDEQGDSGVWLVGVPLKLNERVEKNVGSKTRFINKTELLRFAIVDLCDELDRNPQLIPVRTKKRHHSIFTSGKCAFVREAARRYCNKQELSVGWTAQNLLDSQASSSVILTA